MEPIELKSGLSQTRIDKLKIADLKKLAHDIPEVQNSKHKISVIDALLKKYGSKTKSADELFFAVKDGKYVLTHVDNKPVSREMVEGSESAGMSIAPSTQTQNETFATPQGTPQATPHGTPPPQGSNPPSPRSQTQTPHGSKPPSPRATVPRKASPKKKSPPKEKAKRPTTLMPSNNDVDDNDNPLQPAPKHDPTKVIKNDYKIIDKTNIGKVGGGHNHVKFNHSINTKNHEEDELKKNAKSWHPTIKFSRVTFGAFKNKIF